MAGGITEALTLLRGEVLTAQTDGQQCGDSGRAAGRLSAFKRALHILETAAPTDTGPADTIDRALERVADGTSSYAEFVDVMANLVTELRRDAGQPMMPTEAEAEAVGVDLMVEHRSIRARGLVHCLNVMPNENHTGWIVAVTAPSGAANLPQGQAEILARVLLAGPGEDPREKCAHGRPTATVCIHCLAGDL